MAKQKSQTGMHLNKVIPKTDNQKQVFRDWDDGKHIVISGFAGTGKAQPLDSKILTKRGWVEMGKLSVGDSISSPDGSETTVTAIHPQGVVNGFKVTLKDGRSTECCESHLWKVSSCYWKSPRILTTNEMVVLLKKPYMKNRLFIDLISGTPFEHKEFVIDPYIMGVLLGDGTFRQRATVSYTCQDDEVHDHITNIINESEHKLKLRRKKSDELGYCRSIVRYDSGNDRNPFTVELERMGLIGKMSQEKHIPNEYLLASDEQRWELLRGLMDTDGTCGKTSDTSFVTTSPELRDGFIELVRSLGGICKSNDKQSQYTYKGEKKFGLPSYNITFRFPAPDHHKIFKIKRKQKRASKRKQYHDRKISIKSITPIEPKEMQCISVSSKDKLYVTDDYIVTHNTLLALYMSLLAVEKGKYTGITIVRAPTATSDIGFLPGTKAEKEAVLKDPYTGLLADIYDRGDAFGVLEKKGIVEFTTTAYIRGITLSNRIVFVDECQNLNEHGFDSIITRIGEGSRLILCGDTGQCDLTREETGFGNTLSILDRMNKVAHTNMTTDDILRSGFVKDYIIEREKQNFTGTSKTAESDFRKTEFLQESTS